MLESIIFVLLGGCIDAAPCAGLMGDGTIIVPDDGSIVIKNRPPAKTNPTVTLPCGMAPAGWPCY